MLPTLPDDFKYGDEDILIITYKHDVNALANVLFTSLALSSNTFYEMPLTSAKCLSPD